MAFNLFSAITSWMNAYNALSNTQTGQSMIWKAKQAISPVTQPIQNAFTPAIQTAKSAVSPITNTISNTIVKPAINDLTFQKKTADYYAPFKSEIEKIGITYDDLAELPEEEKQQVVSQLKQIGVTIPWLVEAEQAKIQSQDISKTSSARTGFIENVGGAIQDFTGGAISEVPNVIWNVAEFWSKFGQYSPLNLAWTAIRAGLTDKTYWQLREEQKAQAEQFWKAGVAWKEFVQKYGAYDPKSTSATLWETATDIWASVIWPNKLWVFKPWFLWTTWKLATEWAIAWAKYGVASKWKIDPTEVAVWALWNTLVWWAFNVWWKVAKSILPRSAEEKVAEAIGGNFTKWVVNWKTVKVPVPQEWILTKATKPFRESDPKVLTGRALTPSYAGKTPKQMLKSVWEMTDNVKNFYSQVRTWKMKWNINTLEDAANTVISNLDSVGANIGSAIKWAKWTVWPSVWTMDEITNTLSNKIESRSWAFKPLQNFLEDIKWGLNLQDAFKAKKVYQAEITKLIKAWDAGTDSYSALVKWVQELTDNIDNVVEKSLWSKQLIEWKKQYRLLKSIASDISKSAVVEGRRSPQTFVEQLGTLQAISDGITNPIGTARTLFAKEIWELNTRGGAWKELIKNYDKQAIWSIKKPIIKPKIKVWQ